MGRYGGWGAADAVFAPGASGNDLRDRERLRAVLTRLGGSDEAGERLFRSAGLTVLNAHYTDPVLVAAIYRALGRLGLDSGTVVEPGCGAGQFAAFAPAGIRVTGVELDPATALIAQLLHPGAEILAGSVSGPRFARVRDQSAAPVRVPRDAADGMVGNVPFSEIKWPDEVLNPGQKFSLHDHAIRWGVTRVAPGGLCGFITSRYTADGVNPRFRRTLAAELDLIGMVRLPETAHKRMAGTAVVTDIILGRRIGDDDRPVTRPETWEQSRPLPIGAGGLTARVNTWFHDHPEYILGDLRPGGMRRADDFTVLSNGDLEQQLDAALSEITSRALTAGQRSGPRTDARPVIEIVSWRPDGTITARPDGTFTQVTRGQDVPLEISSDREADQTRKLVALAEARSTLISAEASCPEDTDEIDAMRARMGVLYDDYTAAYGPIGRFTTRTVTYHVKTLDGILDRLDFSRKDVPDPDVQLLESYLGRHALTRLVRSVADPAQVRHRTRTDKQGEKVTVTTQLVQTAAVRAALMTELARIPQGADAEALTATFTGRMSQIERGEQQTRLMPAAFRRDPRRPAVEALETFDPVTQTATRKAVFYRRTAEPHRLELGADTPQEALDLVLIHRRRVDLAEIARLLGTGQADARARLGTLVFDDPATGQLAAASEYLAGNVRDKLSAARAAAAADPDRYTANVEALQAVQPPALAVEDIQARLGSAWLSREIVQEGLRYVLEDPRIKVTHPGGAEWKVESPTVRNSRAQDTYGTSDWNALDLAQALLTNASITVHRTYWDPAAERERTYRDDAATLFAFRKAQRLDADFVAWLWSDPDRADQCVRLYNDTYNNQVKRRWDTSPFHIPGLAPGLRLHPFQFSMVRRLHTESGLAAWVVGAGKTELGITAAMEGHRLGRHQLTAIVTPASLVNQWRDRVYRTFPQARLLVADDDLRGRRDSRAVFTERCASGDYQMAIIPYEFFASLALSGDAARASADEEIAKLTRYADEAADQGDRYTAKQLQGKIARLEARYSAAVRAAGGGDGFTDTGIDSVVVDEWHNFRRIHRDSNNRQLAMPGSDRGNHMLAVFDYLRKHNPGGLLLGLTGTPLEQSIADAWAAMRFFVPGRLRALGLEEFDAFLTTFGRTEPRREPTPTGSGLHVRERQADWFNLPEMRRALWDCFADVVRRADLELNLPRLATGRPQTHVLAQTPGQAEVQADIDKRYEMFKAGDRDGDNHLFKLMDRGAKNALHPRMLGMEAGGQIKLEVWADAAAAWYHATKDAGYLDRDGRPHPVPGALRLVACELGVPDPARPNAWSVYSEMRTLLAGRGVPAQAIRFAQDADSDRKKAALWEDARTGRCSFVIGSSQTAGTGVDIPDRLQVLDYMTLTWNPTPFEQWLGRILRQGNQNPEVEVHVWATEGTTEVTRADRIAMKSAPFEALLDGTSETRRHTEEAEDPLSAWAAEMSARMSGNPLLSAQREALLEVDIAQGMQSEWQRENGIKARRITAMDTEIAGLETENAAIDDALSRAADTRGSLFTARIGPDRYSVRAEAGTALIAALTATAAGDVSALTGGNPEHLGDLAGFPVTARYNRITAIIPDAGPGTRDGAGDADGEPAECTLITLGLEGVPLGQVGVIDARDLPGRDPTGLITSLEDRLRRLPGHKDKNTAAISAARDQIIKIRAELAQPSPYLQQLADAREALDRIETQINAQIKDDNPAPDPAGTGSRPGGAAEAPARPAPVSARAGPQPASSTGGPQPGGPQPAREPAPASAAGDPAPQPGTPPAPGTGPGAEQPVTRPAPAPAAATGAARPAPPPGDGPVIAHNRDGTLVHGTSKDDMQLRRMLRQCGFLWSGRLGAWYLPRPWTFATRDRRVSELSALLQRAGRKITVQTTPPAGPAAEPAAEPVPAGEPYTSLPQAQGDLGDAIRSYWQLTSSPAGNRVMKAWPADQARPDAIALDQAYRAVSSSWHEAFSGGPQQAADRITAWMQAACTLARNLDAEQHRAPRFRETLAEFTTAVTRLASRIRATAQDPGAWAALFPAAEPPASPAAAAGTGDGRSHAPAVPGTGTGEPGHPQADDAGTAARSPAAAQESPGRYRTGREAARACRAVIAAYQQAVHASASEPFPAAGQQPEMTALADAISALASAITPGSAGPPGGLEGLASLLAACAHAGQATAASLPGTGDEETRLRAQLENLARLAHDAAGRMTATATALAAPAAPPEPGPAASGTSTPPSGTAGSPPDAAGSLRALAADYGLTVTADRLSRTNTLLTISDGDRVVLLHDDISGTKAGGCRIGPDEAGAYLTARRDYPGLPAAVLLAWVRRDPSAPEHLTLSAARAIAGQHELTAQPVLAAGEPFIVFREPGGCTAAVLACRPGSPAVSAGPVTVPVPVIGQYLYARRQAVPQRWLTLLSKHDDWASQVIAIAPYLIDGTSLHSPAAWRHVAAAAEAAAADDHNTARAELRSAWTAAGAYVPAPDREAFLVRLIGDVAARYHQVAGDGARYVAEIARACDPEWRWIEQWISDHPDSLTATPPTPEAIRHRTETEAARSAAEGKRLSAAAKTACDAGDYPAALALIDQGETADPDGRIPWHRARQLIAEQAGGAADPQPPASAEPAPAAGAAASAQPGQAELPPAPAGPGSPADLPGQSPPQAGQPAPAPAAAASPGGTAGGSPAEGSLTEDAPAAPEADGPASQAAGSPGSGSSEGSPARGSGTGAPAGSNRAVADPPAGSPGDAQTAAPKRRRARPRLPSAGPPTLFDEPAGQADAALAAGLPEAMTAGGQAAGPGNPASPPPAPAAQEPVTFASPSRGYAARMADLARSPDGSYRPTRHAWGLAITHPSGQTPDCQPTVLDANLRCGHDGGCQCVGSELMYRGVCRGCDWEGPPRARENQATEDAQDHAFPGWRDLPAVKPLPHENEKARARWTQGVTSLYPQGWLDRRGPVRTVRGPSGSRHWSMEQYGMPGGYNMAAGPAETAVPFPAARKNTAIPERSAQAPGAGEPPPQQARAAPPEPAAAGSNVSADAGPRSDGRARPGELPPPAIPAGEAASAAPAPDLTNADPAAVHAMPPGGGAPPPAAPGEDTAVRAEGTRALALGDLTGPSPDWMSAGLCECCGKLHGGRCPAPVTAPPPGLHRDDDELTPLGAVVEDAARYLAMRGYLDPDADGGVPDWVLAELAEIAREKPCGSPGCSVTAHGFLGPSAAADHFLQRRRQEWERWLPRWACTCGRAFKICPEPPGTAFYEITPDGMLGDLAGHVTPDTRRRMVKRSSACPGCGRLFADTVAGRPVTPRPSGPAPALPGSEDPPLTLFGSDTAGSTTGPGSTAGQEAPLRNMDLAAELDRMPGEVFARWLSMGAAPSTAGGLDYQRQGEGSQATAGEDGIEITVSGPDVTRHGLVTWPQAASWIDNGVTPARLGITATASRLHSYCRTHRAQLITAGDFDPDAAAGELAQIRDRGAAMIVDAALATRGAAAPVPAPHPGDPGWHTARMITRPERGAGRAENAMLERLAELRAMIREPQPATPAQIRGAIRRRAQHELPDLIRALDSPAAWRTWVSGQASRPGDGGYDETGDWWHGATPAGLIIDQRGDDRAPVLIRWEEIPAWIQPGITGSLRDALLTAASSASTLFYRTLTAIAHPAAGVTAPSQEEDERAARQRTDAADAIWAAIEAAPAPTAADLDRARDIYRDRSPIQQSLFDDDTPPGSTSTPGRHLVTSPRQRPPAPSPPAREQTAAARAGRLHRAGQPDTRASGTQDSPAPSHRADAVAADDGRAQEPPSGPRPPGTAAPAEDTAGTGQPRAGTGSQPLSAAAAASPAPRPGVHGPPAAAQAREVPEADAGDSRLTADDIYYALRALDPLAFADILRAATSGDHLRSPARRAVRPAGQPGAGIRDTITAGPEGLLIEAAGPGTSRTGSLTWPETSAWLQPGLTPVQRDVIVRACQATLGYAMAGISFRAAGEGDLARAAEEELAALAEAQITAVLDCARAAGTGQPAPMAASVQAAPGQAARITELAAALPAPAPQTRPLSQVQAGDIIGHPGYRLQPFRVAAPPAREGTRASISGRLTCPGDGEPAGTITLVITSGPGTDPPVHVIPLPARSLQPLMSDGTQGAAPRHHPGPRQRTRRKATPAASQGPGLAPRPSRPGPQPGPGAAAARTAPRRGAQPGGGTINPGSTHIPAQEAGDITMPPAPAPASTGSPPGPDPGASPAPDALPTNGQPAAGAGGDAGPDGGSPGEAPGQRESAAQAHADEEEQLRQAVEDAITAIIQRRRAAAPDDAGAEQAAAGIRSAFTSLQQALDGGLPDPLPAEPAGAAGAGDAAAGDSVTAAATAREEQGTGDDLAEALTALLRILAGPSQGRHARGSHPGELGDPETGRLLADLALAAREAQASSDSYRGMPQWQRITAIGRAARDLLRAVQHAAAGFRDEIRADLRRLARAVIAPVSRAVAAAAGWLARRLERPSLRARACQAAWRLHDSSTALADRAGGRPAPAAHGQPGTGQGHQPAATPDDGQAPSQRAVPDAAALAQASFPASPLAQPAQQRGAPARSRPGPAPAPGRHAAPAR